MDETTKAIIEKVTIKYETPTRIPSGHVTDLFYDCIKLTPNDLARLAANAVGDLDQHLFDMTLGVAYSGILFASAVAGGREVAILEKEGRIYGLPVNGHKLVVVEDVIHTGKSVLAAEKIAQGCGAKVVGFACVVDRTTASFTEKPVWSAFKVFS